MADATKATTHYLVRTNPKGAPFVGRCQLCGAEGLSMGDALKPCANLFGVTTEEALLDAIAGEQP